jgi:hypothetical protein
MINEYSQIREDKDQCRGRFLFSPTEHHLVFGYDIIKLILLCDFDDYLATMLLNHTNYGVLCAHSEITQSTDNERTTRYVLKRGGQ